MQAAPTLVPVEHGGAAIAAELLVLHGDVTPDEAKSLLWRRETRQHSGDTYREVVNPGSDRVLIKTITKTFHGVDTVLYVDFPAGGKLHDPLPELLAKSAIASAAARNDGLDAISYLMSATANGIRTPLMSAYEAKVLELMGAVDLHDAGERAGMSDNQGSQRQ